MTPLFRIQVFDPDHAAGVCRAFDQHAVDTGVTARRVGDELEIVVANPLLGELVGGLNSLVQRIGEGLRAHRERRVLARATTE